MLPRTDHMIIRNLDEVLVHDDSYEVKFKAEAGVGVATMEDGKK